MTASIDANGVRTEKSGDGQFYTFTSKSCYESDKDGNTVQLGVANLVNTANNIFVYRGNGYYGDADYNVSADYAAINIITKAGDRYVLRRKSPPANFMASNHKELKDRMESMINTGYIPPIIIYDQGSYTGNSSTPATTTEYYDCPTCYGTGRCQNCYGKGYYSNPYTGNYIPCSCHHGRCPVCNGTGKKVRTRRY